MPTSGVVPEWLLSSVAVATLFTIMFDLGLAILPGELRWIAQRPGLMLKSVFAVLVAVPALAWLVAQVLDLPRSAEVGIMLMAISPGAPIALRRTLDAGGHQSFATALQISVAVLAIVSMPLWIAALDEYYGASATAAPQHLARQVFIVQLLPLGLGMLVRHFAAAPAARLEPNLRKLGGILLVVLLALALIDIWQVVVGAGLRVSLAIVIATTLALGAGHMLGGPDPTTRTAVAISSAARNPGLAFLVATLNAAPPAITAAVLAYLVVAAFTLVPYVAWRRRVGGPPRADA